MGVVQNQNITWTESVHNGVQRTVLHGMEGLGVS